MKSAAPSMSREDLFLKARIDAIYSIAFAMIGMDLLGSVMMAGMFWRQGWGLWFDLWVVVSVLVIGARASAAAAYLSGRFSAIPPRRWAASLIAFSAASGIAWGGALGLITATGT